ncbi:glycosyltransferase family 4 protein [Hymenobacter wooponensis]|nr:glycosyltransferase family 1 protein [Hymenobacter wooponensis]
MLHSGYQKAGFTSEIWRPSVLFGSRQQAATSGLGKWLAYFDKWLVFPLILRWRLLDKSLSTEGVRFHVCDHSNAPYLKHLPEERTGITCHDVLAIRGAFGYADAYCPASGLGKVLQKWILHHLSRAKLLATVSQLTLHQLRELTAHTVPLSQDWRVIHNAFNAEFAPLPSSQAAELLSQAGLPPGRPFILHVGSGQARKNRALLLRMVQALGPRWQGDICFAGEALEPDLQQLADSFGLQARVVSVVKPAHTTLLALYTACEAFIFPSFSEGFGWPVIEAQACGAPVIASHIEPMPEVSGGAALHADPTKPEEFAEALLLLQDPATRADTIERGFANARRFEPQQMTHNYLELFKVRKDLSYAS